MSGAAARLTAGVTGSASAAAPPACPSAAAAKRRAAAAVSLFMKQYAIESEQEQARSHASADENSSNDRKKRSKASRKLKWQYFTPPWLEFVADERSRRFGHATHESRLADIWSLASRESVDSVLIVITKCNKIIFTTITKFQK